MSKKRYMTPSVAVTQITTGMYLCDGSLNKTTPTTGLDDELGNGGDDPGDFSRRRRTIWDDEEDEEF